MHGDGGWGRRLDEKKGLAREHTYITHSRRQQCGDGQREGGWGLGGGRQRGGHGDLGNSINDKSKEKNK